jgi:hypothetical protein
LQLIAGESFFAVSTFEFANTGGRSRCGRYRVLPAAGNEYLDEKEAAARSPDFLFDEIKERVTKEPAGFRVVVQLAADGDIVDDATVRWPEDRPRLALIRSRAWTASKPRPILSSSREPTSMSCPAGGAERPEGGKAPTKEIPALSA